MNPAAMLPTPESRPPNRSRSIMKRILSITLTLLIAGLATYLWRAAQL